MCLIERTVGSKNSGSKRCEVCMRHLLSPAQSPERPLLLITNLTISQICTNMFGLTLIMP